MGAPDYTWVCHKCGVSNEPGTDSCGSCGFASNASLLEIDSNEMEAFNNASTGRWILFPDGYVGILIAIFTPLWVIKLVIDQNYLAAFTLSFVLGVCSYMFIVAMTKKHTFVAYIAIVVFVAIAWAVNSSLVP